jgi:hypothetical protein
MRGKDQRGLPIPGREIGRSAGIDEGYGIEFSNLRVYPSQPLRKNLDIPAAWAAAPCGPRLENVMKNIFAVSFLVAFALAGGVAQADGGDSGTTPGQILLADGDGSNDAGQTMLAAGDSSDARGQTMLASGGGSDDQPIQLA